MGQTKLANLGLLYPSFILCVLCEIQDWRCSLTCSQQQVCFNNWSYFSLLLYCRYQQTFITVLILHYLFSFSYPTYEILCSKMTYLYFYVLSQILCQNNISIQDLFSHQPESPSPNKTPKNLILQISTHMNKFDPIDQWRPLQDDSQTKLDLAQPSRPSLTKPNRWGLVGEPCRGIQNPRQDPELSNYSYPSLGNLCGGSLNFF